MLQNQNSKMKKILFLNSFILLTCSFLFTIIASAQYRLDFKIKGLDNKEKCYLVHAYRDDKSYIFKDTADINTTGGFVFEGNENLPQGLYSVAKGKAKLFDFVLVDQKFSIETDTTDLINSMKITGSKEASDFAEFVKARIAIMRKLDKNNPESQKIAFEQTDKLTRDYVKSHPNMFSGNFMKATLNVDLPTLPPNATLKDTLAVNAYYFNHYFDNIELSDDRLIRTPILENAFDYYMGNIMYSDPDTIIKYADEVIAKTKLNSEFRKLIILKFGQKFIAPDLLGRDKVYIHIAEKYIIGEPKLFDTTTVNTNIKFVKSMKPLLLGNVIPNAFLTDTLDIFSPLHGVISKYTLFVLYDPLCGHCQEYTKKLVENQSQLITKGIKVYLACHERNKDQWKKFIKDYKTEKFINVFDSQTITDFTALYNSTNLPTAFFLDKDKKILSNKRLEINDLFRMIEGIEKIKK